MVNVYLNLDKEELEKTKIEANKHAIKEYGEESDTYLYDTLEGTLENAEFDNGTLNIGVDTKLGYIDVTVDLDMALASDIVKYSLNQFQKVKEAFDSMWGK